jgi:GST-like protein
MIDLYFWTTDNGYKVLQMLEETGLDYAVKPVNLRNREQHDPVFLKISPGHKIPAIVDPDGPGGRIITLCESGAILKYLAEKAGCDLYPEEPGLRAQVDQWFFYGTSTFTPHAQQFLLFYHRFEFDVPQAKAHYSAALRDMLSVLDRHLAENEYFAGDYSIADISCYPDVHIHAANIPCYSSDPGDPGDGESHIGLDDYPNVRRWHDAIEARPAVQGAWANLTSIGMPPRGYR